LANSIAEGSLQSKKELVGDVADTDDADDEEEADAAPEHLDAQEEWKALKAEIDNGTELLETALANLKTKWAGEKMTAAAARIKAAREIESLSAAKARLQMQVKELEAELKETKEKLWLADLELEILRQGHPVHQIFELKGFIGMEMCAHALACRVSWLPWRTSTRAHACARAHLHLHAHRTDTRTHLHARACCTRTRARTHAQVRDRDRRQGPQSPRS
jgi:hypothetical protein